MGGDRVRGRAPSLRIRSAPVGRARCASCPRPPHCGPRGWSGLRSHLLTGSAGPLLEGTWHPGHVRSPGVARPVAESTSSLNFIDRMGGDLRRTQRRLWVVAGAFMGAFLLAAAVTVAGTETGVRRSPLPGLILCGAFGLSALRAWLSSARVGRERDRLDQVRALIRSLDEGSVTADGSVSIEDLDPYDLVRVADQWRWFESCRPVPAWVQPAVDGPRLRLEFLDGHVELLGADTVVPVVRRERTLAALGVGDPPGASSRRPRGGAATSDGTIPSAAVVAGDAVEVGGEEVEVLRVQRSRASRMVDLVLGDGTRLAVPDSERMRVKRDRPGTTAELTSVGAGTSQQRPAVPQETLHARLGPIGMGVNLVLATFTGVWAALIIGAFLRSGEWRDSLLRSPGELLMALFFFVLLAGFTGAVIWSTIRVRVDLTETELSWVPPLGERRSIDRNRIRGIRWSLPSERRRGESDIRLLLLGSGGSTIAAVPAALLSRQEQLELVRILQSQAFPTEDDYRKLVRRLVAGELQATDAVTVSDVRPGDLVFVEGRWRPVDRVRPLAAWEQAGSDSKPLRVRFIGSGDALVALDERLPVFRLADAQVEARAASQPGSRR